jgi:hypothetical protein
VTRSLAALLSAPLVLFLSCAPAAASTEYAYFDVASFQKLNALPSGLSNHQAKVFGNYLVVSGGRDRLGKPVSQMLTARIRGNGSLEPWKVETPLFAPLSGHAMESLNGYAYIAGGMRTTGKVESPTTQVLVSQLGRDGYPGKWRRTTDLPEGIYAHAMVASADSLFILGGNTADGISNSVYRGIMEKDGRISSWKQVTSLPSALAYASAVVVNGYIVVVGGQSPAEGKTLIMPTTYVGPLVKDGEPSTWYLASSRLPGAWLGYGRCQAGLLEYRNTLFCFGGQDSSWFYISNIAASGFNPENGELEGWGVSEAPKEMVQVSPVTLWKDRVFMVGGIAGGRISAQVSSLLLVSGEKDDPK